MYWKKNISDNLLDILLLICRVYNIVYIIDKIVDYYFIESIYVY